MPASKKSSRTEWSSKVSTWASMKTLPTTISSLSMTSCSSHRYNHLLRIMYPTRLELLVQEQAKAQVGTISLTCSGISQYSSHLHKTNRSHLNLRSGQELPLANEKPKNSCLISVLISPNHLHNSNHQNNNNQAAEASRQTLSPTWANSNNHLPSRQRRKYRTFLDPISRP